MPPSTTTATLATALIAGIVALAKKFLPRKSPPKPEYITRAEFHAGLDSASAPAISPWQTNSTPTNAISYSPSSARAPISNAASTPSNRTSPASTSAPAM